MKFKYLTIALFSVILIGGGILVFQSNSAPETAVDSQNNVSNVDGKQVIEISVKGGYFPRVSAAKANLPTILKMKTNGTFDCSSALVIPSLNYRTNLPLSGEKLIELPPQAAGTTMQGICSMGMYSFSINFS